MKKIALFLLLAGLLISCKNSSPGKTETFPLISSLSAATETIWPFPTSSNTSTPSPNPTTTPRMPTATQSRTATTSPTYNIQSQCIEISPALNPEIVSEGVLLLAAKITNQGEQLGPHVFLNLKTGDKQPLLQAENDSIIFFEVSPDQSWLAYTKSTVDQAWIVITNAQGQTITSIPKFIRPIDLQEPIDTQIGSLMDYSWLDNQHLIIRVINLKYDEMLILNPFTGERKQFFADYPYSAYWTHTSWKIFNVHDSILTQVVYPGYADEFDSSMVLYDVQNQELLANIEAYKTFAEPKWSPDNTLVAMTFSEFPELKPIKKELYIMERDGQLHQLTFFTDIFEDASVENFNWSPDSSKIAFTFWDSNKENFSASIAIVDVASQEITIYCFSGVSNPPVWSPNGKQLAISADSLTDDKTEVIIIDIESGTAFQIAEEMYPVGWMISPNE